MINTWFKIFFRNLKKRPLYPLVNLLGLTAGITCFLLAMLYVGNEFSYEKWNPDAEKIYQTVIELPDGQVHAAAPYPLAEANVNSFEELTDFTLFRDGGENLISFEEKSFFSQKSFVQKNFLDFFPFPLKYGNPKTALEHKSSIVITEALATKLFGDANPIDKEIKLNNKNPFTVKGVYQLKGNNTHLDYFDMLIPMDPDDDVESWGNFNYRSYYKSNMDVSNEMMSKKLTDFYIESAAKVSETSIEEVRNFFTMDIHLEKISDIHLYSRSLKGRGTTNIFILSLLSLLILIMSAVHFINLSISGATHRAKEVAVRKTLGSEKKSIVLQFVLEVFVLCIIAICLSLALVEIILPAFGNLLDVDLHILNVLQDLPTLFITILLLVLFAGLFPAIYLSNFNPVKVLKGNFSRSKSGTLLKKGLIAFQFAICAIFLIGTFVINSQLSYMNNKDLGFNRDQVIIIEVSDREVVGAKTDLYKQELTKMEGVQKVFMSDRPPGTMAGFGSMTQVEHEDQLVPTDIHFIDHEFFPAMEIDIVEGRNFLPTERFDTIGINKVMVNQKLVREFNLENPLGAKLEFWDRDCEIVGVVDDYITRGFGADIQPAVYGVDYEANAVMLKVKPENISQTIGQIEDFWTTKIEPGFPMQYDFLDKDFATLYEDQQKLQSLVSALSFIMILIAILGLFAVATHSIQQRYKEVAIRKTIGASESQILGNLIKDFVMICAGAILVAIPVAYILSNRWLEDFTYRIEMPVLPYFVAPLMILALTVFVIWTQAKKALKVDLVEHLKYE